MNHMDKEKKKRSGSQRNRPEWEGAEKQVSQTGAPQKSNRQTGDHEKDDSSRGARRNTSKKGPNSV